MLKNFSTYSDYLIAGKHPASGRAYVGRVDGATQNTGIAGAGQGAMRRYFITLGAPTNAGGKVVSASSESQIDGAAIALEGDLVACPACGTTGKIRCVDPRIPETWNGRNVALENDLCICRCDTPPRLMTSQVLRSQVIKDSGRALSNSTPRQAPAGAAAGAFSEQFVLVDEGTGSPARGREYALVRSNGKLEFGTCDAQGRTHVLSATAHAEVVEVYVEGPLFSAALISPSGAVLHHRAQVRTTRGNDAGPRTVGVPGDTPLPECAQPDELVQFLPE